MVSNGPEQDQILSLIQYPLSNVTHLIFLIHHLLSRFHYPYALIPFLLMTEIKLKNVKDFQFVLSFCESVNFQILELLTQLKIIINIIILNMY